MQSLLCCSQSCRKIYWLKFGGCNLLSRYRCQTCFCRDLADINNDGRLTRDGFAVALHLIQGKLSGKDVPASLPPSLVPPSMRTPVPLFTAPAPQLSEPIRDLLWDDSASSSTVNTQPQSTLQPQQTGAQAANHFPTSSVTDPFGAPAVNSRRCNFPPGFAMF